MTEDELKAIEASVLIDDVRRLRAALMGLVDWNRKRYPPRMGGDEFPPSLRTLMDAASRALGDAP